MYSFQSKNGWSFHHHGDYSGDVIVCPPENWKLEFDCDEDEIRIDGDALKEFMFSMYSDIVNEAIETALDDLHGRLIKAIYQ